jgi:predicted enzyme related to lactoylglutathione lyase
MSIKKFAFVGFPNTTHEESERFFGELLGLPVSNRHGEQWLEFDTPDGKTIAIDGYSPPGSNVYLALETDDLEGEVERLRAGGVPIIKDVMDNKVCKMALVAGPGGHMVMLHQIAPDRA